MYIFCSADRTKPGAISLLTSAWKRLLIILSLKVGKIGQSIIDTHKKIESATVGTYKGVENYVVDAYKAIETAFVDRFLESVVAVANAYLILEAITQEQHNLCSNTDIKAFSPFSDSSTCCQFQYCCMIYKIKKPQAQYLRLLSCFFLPLNV